MTPQEAEMRALEAREQRFKHTKAANAWLSISMERPERLAVATILAEWTTAYADADAKAEKAFRALVDGKKE